MRFLLIDRFLKLTKEESVVALKSMSNDFIKEHFPRKPVIPATMAIEAIGQIGSWLVLYASKFRYGIVLALLRDSGVKRDILPGDRIECHAEIISLGEAVSEVDIKGYIDGELAVWTDVVFSHLLPYNRAEQIREIKRFNYLTGLNLDPGEII